jgi:phage major head subunit gpT-like protein
MFYNEHPLECVELFDGESSDKSYEEDVLVPGFGLAPVKAQGAAVVYDTHQQGFVSRYTHVSYGLGYILTREEIEDNLYIKLAKQRTRALAFAMRQTKENVGANIYNRAFTAAFAGGDGKELLATDHPTLAGNQSNELAVAADMSEASLEDLLVQIMNATDDRGLKISLMPRKLIVPPALVFESERILKSTLQNDTANNAVNAIKSTGMLKEGVVVNHYLTDADAFFIRTNVPTGLTMYNRTAIAFSEDNDFDTENLKYKAFERYSFGWTDFRALFGSPGA